MKPPPTNIGTNIATRIELLDDELLLEDAVPVIEA